MLEPKRSRGSTLIGFVMGLVVGVGAALAVAVYVTKVPVPFVDRGVTRKPEQDVKEAERNKGWNPNAGMGFKHELPAPPVQPAESKPPAETAEPKATEAKPIDGKPSPDAVGELIKQKAQPSAGASGAPAGPEKAIYLVQAGAFRADEEAQAQRAKLVLLGMNAQVSEREQGGKPIFRVRLGPFKEQDKAEAALGQLKANGIDAALIRVQQP